MQHDKLDGIACNCVAFIVRNFLIELRARARNFAEVKSKIHLGLFKQFLKKNIF